MAEGNGNGGGPWWAKLLQMTLQVSGPLGLIAVVLTYLLATSFYNNIAEINKNMILHLSDTQAMYRQMERSLDTQTGLTRQICFNSAEGLPPDKRDDARNACWKP